MNTTRKVFCRTNSARAPYFMVISRTLEALVVDAVAAVFSTACRATPEPCVGPLSSDLPIS
jgi:hypothetical protein